MRILLGSAQRPKVTLPRHFREGRCFTRFASAEPEYCPLDLCEAALTRGTAQLPTEMQAYASFVWSPGLADDVMRTGCGIPLFGEPVPSKANVGVRSCDAKHGL